MAGSRRGGATGALTVEGKFKPLPDYAVTFARDYDIKGIWAMLVKASPCSLEERIEVFRKNVEQFKKPDAIGTFPNKGKAKYEEEESDVEEEEDDDAGVIQTLKLQVPTEGGRACKKSRFT